MAKDTTVRTRVCRVAASVTIAGVQDTAIRVVDGFEDGKTVVVRIGTLLVYIEDTMALTAFVEAAVAASLAGDGVFGRDKYSNARRTGAWTAMHGRVRPA